MMDVKTTSRIGGVLFVAFSVLAAGCATHSIGARAAINSLRAGDTASALLWSEKLKSSAHSGALGSIESGRIKMLRGDFVGSRTDFKAAIDTVFEETENGPVIQFGSLGSTLLASTVADDTVRKYELAPYEVIQLLHYQTLNYLFSGDPQGASVEMRRTVFAQDAIAEHHAKEVEEASVEADQIQADAGVNAMAAVNAKMESMGPVLERTTSAYENGMAWYFCGLMFEKQGDLANANLCYRKAWELAPHNPCIMKDFFRLLQTQDQPAFHDLVLRNHIDVRSLTRSSTEIVVLYEENLISQRHAEKISLPIQNSNETFTMVSIDFPFYSDPAYMPSPLVLTDNGAKLGYTEPAVYLQSLAYRDLKDKILGVVARNVTRAVEKVASQQLASRGNLYARYGMMAFNAASSLSATSDTRAWYSIPMATQLYRGSISPGTHNIECRSPLSGVALTIPITITKGETRLIWIADTGGIAVAATASISGKGSPPTCQQFNNSFWINAGP